MSPLTLLAGVLVFQARAEDAVKFELFDAPDAWPRKGRE